MRTRTLIAAFIASALLGGALGIGWMRFKSRPLKAIDVINSKTSAAPRNPSHDSIAPLPRATAFDWRQVESEEYPRYIANLRAIRCPEETIRDLVVMDVTRLFAHKRAAVKHAQPFWFSAQQQRDSEKAVRAQLADLDEQERLTLEKLLGFPWRGLAAYLNSRDAVSWLPRDKAQQLAALDEKFAGLKEEVRRRAGGSELTFEQQVEWQHLQRQYERELEGLLSPPELEEHLLRTSNSAEILRAELSGLKVTEDEFRQLFRFRKALDDVIAAHDDDYAGNAAAQKEVADALARHEEQVRQFLGETRYQEYRRGQDSAYQALVDVAEQYGLSTDAANRAYQCKQRLDAQKETLQKSLPREQQLPALEPLKAEAAAQLKSILGETAFQTYLKRAGDWVRSEPAIAAEPSK